MRIGIFTDGYSPSISGVTTSVEATARELKARGHELTIVAPKYPHYKDREPVIRIPSVLIPGQKNFRLATYVPGTSLVLANQLDVDIIHGHTGGPVSLLGWETARVKRIPFVLTYHTLFNQYTHYIFKGKVIKPRMAEIATRIFGNASDCLIAPTEKVKDELQSYGIKKPVYVIPSGIDLRAYEGVEKSFLRNKFNISRDSILLLFVGRLGKEKSIDFLLRAFALAVKQRNNLILVIVGDGPDRLKLEDQAKKLGILRQVRFTGFISPPDMPKVYTDADMFVFCSRTETQGLVVPEAMAAQIPVVVVDDPAYQGVVEHNRNGLVAKRTAKDFAKLVVWLANHPQARAAYGEQAQRTAERYSLQSCTDLLEQLYTDLVSQAEHTPLLYKTDL